MQPTLQTEEKRVKTLKKEGEISAKRTAMIRLQDEGWDMEQERGGRQKTNGTQSQAQQHSHETHTAQRYGPLLSL